MLCCFFFFKQKTAYEMRISDWSSDVCSSDLTLPRASGGCGGSCIGEPSLECTCQPHGSEPTCMSSPVNTASTPGAAAADVSMRSIRACAWLLDRKSVV